MKNFRQIVFVSVPNNVLAEASIVSLNLSIGNVFA